MKAPNGKPTNLTERQWLHVRTKNFKKWFGDWENDPANASKVVDENGEPLVVYHGNSEGYSQENNDTQMFVVGEKGAKSEANKKSPSKNEPLYLNKTDIHSKKDATKIQKDLKSVSEKYKNQKSSKGFLTDLSNALGIEKKNASEYVKFTAKDGTEFTIRVSNHNASADTFENNGELNGNISIVVKNKGTKNTFKANDNVELTEYVYFKEDIAKSDANVLSQIAESLSKTVENGSYTDTTGLASVNVSRQNNISAAQSGDTKTIEDFWNKQSSNELEVQSEKRNNKATLTKPGTHPDTFNGEKLSEIRSPKGGNVTDKFYTEQGSEYIITEDGMTRRVKAPHQNTAGTDSGLHSWQDRGIFTKGQDGEYFNLSVANLIDAGFTISVQAKNGKAIVLLYDKQLNKWRDAKFSDSNPKAVKNGLMRDVAITCEYSDKPEIDSNLFEFNNDSDGRTKSVHPGSKVVFIEGNNGEYSQENNDMQMFVVGEKGAKSMDEAEEVTTRMDNLSVANDMEKSGKDALTIKAATGWERGADGKWRYEIPDIKLKKYNSGNEIIRETAGKSRQDLVARRLSEVVDLSSLPPIYREELEARGQIRVYDDVRDTVKGFSATVGNKVVIGINLANTHLESTLVHEIQHHIQAREGFESGGDQLVAKEALLKKRGLLDEYNKAKTAAYGYDRALLKILDSDERYQKYRRIATKLKLLLETMPEEIEISRQKRSEYIKKRIPEWEIDVNYTERARNRIDELKAGHREILAEAMRNQEKALEKVYAIEATLPNNLYKAYRSLAGEAEARAVGRRIALSMEERRNSLLTDEIYKDVAAQDLLFIQAKLENSIAESRKFFPQHNKNDISAFHLKRSFNELSNDIFKLSSEKKYKKEIQNFIEKLPQDVDRSEGVWYMSKDGKRAFRINTSVENFEENKKETSFGFEVVDWCDLEKLSKEQRKEVQDGINNRKGINSILSRIEYARSTNNSGNGLLTDRETAINNAGLDLQTSSGESIGGRDFGDSRSNQRASEVEDYFMTPQGEIYGFVSKNGDIYLDENIITPEHPIHEFTHFWDRIVKQKNSRLGSIPKSV